MFVYERIMCICVCLSVCICVCMCVRMFVYMCVCVCVFCHKLAISYVCILAQSCISDHLAGEVTAHCKK